MEGLRIEVRIEAATALPLDVSVSTPSMFEHLSVLTGGSPVPLVWDVSLVQNIMQVSLRLWVLRRGEEVLEHFFHLSPPARIVDHLYMRSRNDLNCGTP
jgi:hypothetical protein